jgi:hypothetical protein
MKPPEPVTTDGALYWMTVTHGKIHMIARGWPPHELTSSQIALTKEEFYFLESMKIDWNDAKRVVRNIERKLRK